MKREQKLAITIILFVWFVACTWMILPPAHGQFGGGFLSGGSGGSGGGLLTADGTTAILPVTYDSLDVTGSIRANSIYTTKLTVDTVSTTHYDAGVTIQPETDEAPLTVNDENGDAALVVDKDKQVGIGIASPASNFHIYQDSPTANQTLFQVGTSDDASRFSADEDGDLAADGSLTLGSNIYLSNNGTIGRATENSWIQFTGSVIYAQQNEDISSGDFFKLGPTGTDDELTASTGHQNFFLAEPEVDQSGDAAYTGIGLDVTETGTGSGDSYLLDLQVGGTSKFSVDNSGNVNAAEGNFKDVVRVDNMAYEDSGIKVVQTGLDLTFKTRQSPSGSYNNEHLVLQANTSNVGVNTNSPQATLDVNGTIGQDSLTTEAGVDTLADDGEMVLETGVAGKGWAMAGDNEEYIEFRFTSAGVVTLLSDVSANTANTDSDGNLCVYDAGDGIAIKNRLGAEKNVAYRVHYFLP